MKDLLFENKDIQKKLKLSQVQIFEMFWDLPDTVKSIICLK